MKFKDSNDYHSGYSCLFPFGEYEGGDLLLPEIKASCKLKPGDLLFFTSDTLRHGNSLVTQGVRRSIVLTMSNKLVNIMKNKENCNSEEENENIN